MAYGAVPLSAALVVVAGSADSLLGCWVLIPSTMLPAAAVPVAPPGAKGVVLTMPGRGRSTGSRTRGSQTTGAEGRGRLGAVFLFNYLERGYWQQLS
jgi:hypothetical protein